MARRMEPPGAGRGGGHGFSDPNLPPKPATPVGRPVTGTRIPIAIQVIVGLVGGLAIVFAAFSLAGLNFQDFFGDSSPGQLADHTTPSGVSVTGGSLDWGTCDAVTKGYLPGGTNCHGTVVVALTPGKPVGSGQLVVTLDYRNAGPFHGGAAVTAGQKSVTVPITTESISACIAHPDLTVSASDGPVDAAGTAVLYRNDKLTIPDDRSNFPSGGL